MAPEDLRLFSCRANDAGGARGRAPLPLASPHVGVMPPPGPGAVSGGLAGATDEKVPGRG